MFHGKRQRIIQHLRNVVQERRHREHIHRVVIEHAFERTGIAAAEVIEIHLRNQPTGDVLVRPLRAENVYFERAERAALQALAPQSPRERQQIEVRHRREWSGGTVGDIARVKERHVERFAVERYERGARFQ